MEYTALYRRDGEAWVAELVEEPGCHTWGDTREEARFYLRDATALWFEVNPDSFELT